jgi:outer membrane protein assembly factor BamB
MKTHRCVWLAAAIVCAWNITAFAQQTPAGTQIRLRALATYLDANNNSYSAISNEQILTVGQVAGIELTMPINSAVISPGSAFSFPVTLKNTGNGTDRFRFHFGTVPPGWSITLIEDTNRDGRRDAGETTVIGDQTKSLQMNEEYHLLVKVTAPNSASGGQTYQIPLRVSSVFDTATSQERNLMASVQNTLEARWMVQVPGGVSGDVTITGGKAIIGSNTGQLYAYWVNGQNAGTTAWETRLGAAMPGRVAARASVLYVPTADGRVLLVDSNSGTVQRNGTVASGFRIEASPVVQNGILFVPANNGRIYSYDANGLLLAVSDQWGNQFSSTPSAPGTTHLWVGTGDGYVVCLRSADLRHEWEEPISPGSPVTSSPWIDIRTNTLFIGAQNGLFWAMHATPNPMTSHLKWSYNARAPIVGSPFFDSVAQVVYFGTTDGKIHAVHAVNGTAKTGYPIRPPDAGRFLGMPIVVRKQGSNTPYIYIGSDNGKFYAINADAPDEFHLYDGSNNGESFVRSPSISGLSADDVVVAASQNGKVLAFPLK